MKISLHWLKQYVTSGLSVESLAHKLTMSGLEVEAINNVGGDTVMEFEITPNRADCLSMIGIAREVSAICNKPLKQPKLKKYIYPKKKCDIKIEDCDACPRYIGTLIENVVVKSAEKDITQPLMALGMRPINNVVDITNFSLLENGQPLHAFDFDKLEGGKIVVRRAKKGEKIITLDGEERKLDPSILIIADSSRPIAIAGVMGGKDTQVTKETKNILLESAYFDSVLIRRVSRKLSLISDSSYRFERGVDYLNVDKGANRAIDLILSATGGKISERIDVVSKKIIKKDKKLIINIDKVNNFLGAKLSVGVCKQVLKNLGFTVSNSKQNVLDVVSPSFRSDIHQFVDVVEEIGRVIGYDNLPESMPVVKGHNVAGNPKIKIKQKLHAALMGQGLSEIVTFAMIGQDDLTKAGLSNERLVKITNPLTLDQEIMRPSLLTNHLKVSAGNVNRGQKDLKLFEIGKIYPVGGEQDVLAVTLIGKIMTDWRQGSRNVDFYDLKGCIETALSTLNAQKIIFKPFCSTWLEEGQSAEVMVGGKVIGFAGKISEDVLKRWGIKQVDSLWFAQFRLDDLYLSAQNDIKFDQISEYPEMVRDVSLAVNKDITYQQVVEIVAKNGGKLLKNIRFIEEYLGDKIKSGQRGLVFSLHFQSNNRTLTENEVTQTFDSICSALIRDLGVVKR